MLTERQRGWQEKARLFADEEIRPVSLQRDLISDPLETFDWELIRKGSEQGFRTAAVSKAWGGGEIDTVSQVLVMAELSRGDVGVSKTLSQCWKWSQVIETLGTDDQKERFLRPFMEDHTHLLAKASTEEVAGSDNKLLNDLPEAGFRLKAEKDGDHWVLNGRKRYIANGSVASTYIIMTRTNTAQGIRHGATMFLVPKDTPGFRVGKVYDKIGWRFYQNAELIFENARVPQENMIGEVDGAFDAFGGHTNEFGDWELAASALGVCDAAVEMALAHCKTRIQGGGPLIGHQAIQLKLSEMQTLTETLRAYVMDTAREVDEHQGKNEFLAQQIDPKRKTTLMIFATDAVQRVTHINMEVHGGAGVMKDVGAEKLVRDSMVWTHLAGDSVRRMSVTRRL